MFRANGLTVYLAQPKNRRFAGLGLVAPACRRTNGLAVSYAGSSNGQAVGPRDHLAMIYPALRNFQFLRLG